MPVSLLSGEFAENSFKMVFLGSSQPISLCNNRLHPIAHFAQVGQLRQQPPKA